MTRESRMEAVARDIFSQVRTSIVMKMRFLDMAVFRLKLCPSEIELATDGDYLYYDPVWVLKRYREESNSVTRDYMHVLIHCIFRHPFVNTLVDHELWDLSCDIAVEAMIQEFSQPFLSVKAETDRNAVITKLRGSIRQMTAEKLYHHFQDNPPPSGWADLFRADDHRIWYDRQMRQSLQQLARRQDKQNSQNSPEMNDGEYAGVDTNADTDDSKNTNAGTDNGMNTSAGNDGGTNSDVSSVPASSDALTGIEDEWKGISEHVQMDLESFGKQQGYQAGSMEQLLAAVNREKYDYTAFLKKFAVMGEVMKINDDEFDYIFYTYGLKLFENMPLIEPLEYKEVKRIRDFVIAIDTSGSTSGELVQKFLNKTWNILQSTESFFSKVNIYIIQCDAKIQESVRITKKEEFDNYLKSMTIKGLGGTDFRPVFTYVDKLIREKAFTNLKGMIYFTDGYGTFPEQKPDYQTAFVFVRDEFNNPNVPPWAIKLVLEKDEI